MDHCTLTRYCQIREVMDHCMYTANKILSDKRGDGSLYTAGKILSDKRGDGSLYTANKI